MSKVTSAKGLEDLIELRATKQLTRQGVTVFELLLGVGGFSQFGLGGAAGVLLAKRFVESPTFRISLARTLQGVNKNTLTKISKEMIDNNLSNSSVKNLQSIIEKSKNNLQFIESGATIIDELSDNVE